MNKSISNVSGISLSLHGLRRYLERVVKIDIIQLGNYLGVEISSEKALKENEGIFLNKIKVALEKKMGISTDNIVREQLDTNIRNYIFDVISTSIEVNGFIYHVKNRVIITIDKKRPRRNIGILVNAGLKKRKEDLMKIN